MIVEKFVTDRQMDGWTDRQADGRTDGWMDGRENRQSLLDLQFSLQNRTIFHIFYKKLIPERKKIWDFIFFVRSSQGLSDFGGCC